MIDAIAEMGAEWPLNNKCLTANIVYEAVVSVPSTQGKKYCGV